MSEYFKRPEEVGFLQPKKAQERVPKGKVEEVFQLSGFFNDIELRSRTVGNSFFRYPSTTEIARWHYHSRPSVLKLADAKLGTSHARSVTNIIDWIDKGVAALDEAKKYETDPSKDITMEHLLKVARDAFKTAQHISEGMGTRYNEFSKQNQPPAL